MSAQQALLTILEQKIRDDSLVLPTLPEIALKVRQSAEDPKISLAKMADVIAQDPALAGWPDRSTPRSARGMRAGS